MTRTTNVMLLTIVFVAVLLLPSQVLAMDIQQFAAMTAEDQRHYLSFLVRESEELLTQQGQRNEARKVERLFYVPRGSDRSIGESQFYSLLPQALHFVTNVPPPLKSGMRSSVESLLSQVLLTSGVTLTRNFTETLSREVRNRAFYQEPN